MNLDGEQEGMQIYRLFCVGEGKDVVCRADVELESAECFVCHTLSTEV